MTSTESAQSQARWRPNRAGRHRAGSKRWHLATGSGDSLCGLTLYWTRPLHKVTVTCPKCLRIERTLP